MVALHGALGAAARGGGVWRGERRGRDVRQRAERGGVPLRPRRAPTSRRRSSRAHDRALRGDRRRPSREARRLIDAYAEAARRPRRAARRARASGTRAGAGAARRVWRRCSSSSSRRCSRTTSASPSTAASTAYSASSTSVGSGNPSPERSGGRYPRPTDRGAAGARREAACRRRTCPRRRPARAPRRRRRAPRSTRRSGRYGAPRTCPRGRRSGAERCASQMPRPAAPPCARTEPPIAGGSGSTRSGTIPAAERTGCRPAAWFPRVDLDLGVPAVDDLANRLVQRRRVVDRRERRETHGHPLGEALLAGSRTEDTKERPDRPVSRRHRREHLGQRAPRGHQNSSASELITQSAPYSVAASRAMRVTHSS